jgi:hypothetical protein
VILRSHLPYYEEIFALPGFLADPIVVFGYQDVESGIARTSPFSSGSLPEVFRALGYRSVVSLDHFDSRAELSYDMNLPVPESEHGKYRTLIDIGCLEHVFDTLQCLENCGRMLQVGGHYLLHTPVNGYFGHGLHVFNPQGLVDCLELNGFALGYLKFSTSSGVPVRDPSAPGDCLIWLVARKVREAKAFTAPQQRNWGDFYASRGR